MIAKWKPDLVAFEDIQLQKFTTNSGCEGNAVLVFKKLAHLQGVLKNYCYENNILYTVIPPATWRHHSDIKGKNRTDRKRNAQLKIKRLYDVSVTQDQADAILLTSYAAFQHKASSVIMFKKKEND